MSLSIYNSTNVPLINGSTFTGQFYDNVLEFTQINISIKCDTAYTLTYYFSQDKQSINYQKSQNISASNETLFINTTPLERYFKIGITASGGNMSILELQTTYKTNNVYQDVNTKLMYDDAISAGSYTNAVNMSNTNKSIITFYGKQNGVNNELTVCVSNDNINYYATQYTYICTNTGDFGFSVNIVGRFVKILSKNNCNLTVYMDY
jgi:hypothetical protein